MAKRSAEPPERSESSSYLRSRKPVRVRRGIHDWRRLPLRWVLASAAFLGIGLSSAYSVDTYLHSSPRFQLPQDPGALRVTGLQVLKHDAVKRVLQEDFGAPLPAIPLGKRRRQLLEMPWVRNATLARVWPNQLWLHIEERQPVAFVSLARRNGRHALTPKLIDRDGVILEPPAGAKFSLPVISGVLPKMALAQRKERVALFGAMMDELDGQEPRYGELISEVDLSDPQNALVTTVYEGEVVQLHLGAEHFRHRYELFLKYFPSWKQEFGKVRSIDLRFKGHVAIQ